MRPQEESPDNQVPYSLHWVCWHPTPYHAFLFQALSSDPEIDLTVHFCEGVFPSHPWQTDLRRGFRSRCFNRKLGLDGHLLRLAVCEPESFFVISGWNEPTMIMMINLLGMYSRRFAVWTDTPQLERPRSFFKKTARSAWFRWVFQRVQAAMGTGMTGTTALALMGCPESKLVNFPTFIDLEIFSPQKNSAPMENGPFTFLSSGRLVNSIKAHDLALKALDRAEEKVGEIGKRWRYRIAGVGPDKDKLLSLSQELGLAERLEFTGWLEPSQLPDFYHGGQVLLHPSNIDNYPNAVMEAMACGLTVIGSNTTGVVNDRIQHGENGLIHRMGDVEDLATQIAWVLAHPKELLSIGARARATAEEWPISRGVIMVKDMLRNSDHRKIMTFAC